MLNKSWKQSEFLDEMIVDNPSRWIVTAEQDEFFMDVLQALRYRFLNLVVAAKKHK